MSKTNKTIFVIGIALILYGYLSRIFSVYFFWEGKYIGWELIVIGCIIFLSKRVKYKRAQSKKSLWEKIGVGILIFLLVVQCGLYFIFPRTDAYRTAIEHLSTNQKLKDEVGEVKKISMVPIGSLAMQTSNDGESGNAMFYFIVKGDKKYKDVTIELQKMPDTEWTVLSIR